MYTSTSATLKSHRAGRDNQGNFEDIKSVTGDDEGRRATRINNVNVSFFESRVSTERERNVLQENRTDWRRRQIQNETHSDRQTQIQTGTQAKRQTQALR